MKAFGADDKDFEIKINDRVLLNEKFGNQELIRLLDRKNKMSPEDFDNEWQKISGEKFDANIQPNETITTLLKKLKEQGITNAVFDPTVTRGFDYYTGIVFEVFDTSPLNSRSLFGGGRYDNLLEIFGVELVPTIGFAMGESLMKGMRGKGEGSSKVMIRCTQCNGLNVEEAKFCSECGGSLTKKK